MKIFRLNTNPDQYSSNSYLLLGSFNKIEDINTIIDTGYDDYISSHIDSINTGVGKKAVEKIILTHNHFDHSGGVDYLRNKYNAQCMAFLKGKNIDATLNDGEEIKLADSVFKVIHTPGHSQDSICLYCKEEKVLFSGDTPIRIYAKDATYSPDFLESVEKLSRLNIRVVYPGHGEPINENPEKIIRNTLKVLKGEN